MFQVLKQGRLVRQKHTPISVSKASSEVPASDRKSENAVSLVRRGTFHKKEKKSTQKTVDRTK